MVMDYFTKKLTQQVLTDSAQLPDWVTDRNASLRAWKCVEALKIERAKYIDSHSKRYEFANKSSYQVNAAEVARAITLNRSTLMHGSSYSKAFTKYLNEVNAELEAAMAKKLDPVKKNPYRGPISSSKNELVKTNAELRKRIACLEVQNTEELVTLAFDRLPLPVRRTLGLD